MGDLFSKKKVMLLSLLLPLHPALAADPAPVAVAQHTDRLQSGQPFTFRAKRAPDGQTTIELSGFRHDLLTGLAEKNKSAKPAVPTPTRVRIFVDNELQKTVSLTENQVQLFLKPTEQYSLRLEAVTAKGRVIERTEHILFEKKNIRAVNPESYKGEPEFFARSPLDQKLGIDSSLSTLVQKIGRSKVVFLWKNPRDPRIKQLEGAVDFQVLRDESGKVTGFMATNPHRKERNLASLLFGKDDAFVKVDAAFNEHSFLWDDMFTCLHTLTFDPELCRSTVQFWLNVQKHQGRGEGDIPREVLKSNGTSFILYELVHLGETIPNGTYANPNIMGNVVETLLDHGGLTPANRKLARETLASMKAYAGWLDRNRTVKDTDGKLAGYWISDLGSGMDNIGRAPRDHFSKVGYVDEFARRIELEKSSARLQARLGNFPAMKKHLAKAEEFDRILNERYWSPEKSFYYDLVPGPEGKLVRQEDMPTVAGFWPLFSRTASPAQVKAIEAHWNTEETFGGKFPVRSLPPVMAKLRPGSYRPEGGYWRGGNWAPTDIVKALGEERSGRADLAADTIHRKLAADSYVAAKAEKTFGRKTVYETLGTDPSGNPAPGIKVEVDGSIHQPRTDFVGWGGTPHTFGKLRHSLGIRPVPAFGGGRKQADQWIQAVTEHPVFRNTTYFGKSPFRSDAKQRGLFVDGLLEIAPPFALGEEAIEVKNYEYLGQRMVLSARRGKAANEVELTLQSQEPLNLNIAFTALHLSGSEKAGDPQAMSRIMKIQTKAGESQTVTLGLEPVL